MSWFGALLRRQPGHVQAAVPAGTTWQNGYLYRSDHHIDRLLVSGGLTGARAWLELDVTGLDEEDGLDIRLEDAAGNQLPHQLLAYDAGAAKLRVKLPTLSVDQNTVVAAYTGKAGADEADVAALYAGLYMAIDPVTGVDMSGNGRNFTPTGILAGTMSDGWPCGVYTAAANLLSADSASWLAGATEVAMLVDMDVDAAMDDTTSRIFAQGDYFNPGGSDSLQLGRLAVTSGGAADVWFNTIYTSQSLSAYTLGAAQSAGAGLALLVGSWESGLAPDVFVDGQPMATSLEVARGGTVNVRTGGWYIGQAYVGKLGEILLSPDPVSPLQADIEARSRRRPLSLWGVGAWRTVSDPEPCVAMPVRLDAVEEEATAVDIVGRALGSSISVTAVTQGARGTVTLTGGAVTYTSDNTGAGSDFFGFTIQDGNGFESTGRCDVLISAASGGGGGGGDPDAGTVLPSPASTINISSQAQLDAAYAGITSGAAGVRLLLANGSYAMPTVWSKSGTLAVPLQVVAQNVMGVTITNAWSVAGCSNVIFYGLDHPARRVHVGATGQANDIKFWRCRWRDFPEPPNASNWAIRTWACDRLDVAYCTFSNWKGRGIAIGAAAGTRRPTIRRCVFRDTGSIAGTNGYEPIQTGFGFADRWIDCEATIIENLIENWQKEQEAISIKSSANTVTRNLLRNNTGALVNRLGRNNVFSANKIIGGLSIRNHDQGNKWLGNDVSEANEGRISCGNHPVLDELFTSSAPSHPNSYQTLVEGHVGSLLIGHQWSGHIYPADFTTVRDHPGGTGSISYGVHTNTSVNVGAAATETWPELFAATDAGGSPNVGVFGS